MLHRRSISSVRIHALIIRSACSPGVQPDQQNLINLRGLFCVVDAEANYLELVVTMVDLEAKIRATLEILLKNAIDPTAVLINIDQEIVILLIKIDDSEQIKILLLFQKIINQIKEN